MYLAILIALTLPVQTQCWGEGPVGVYPLDSRRALVAESDRQSIMLVDIQHGGIIEELWLASHPHFANLQFDRGTGTGSYFHVVCVASCSNCDFALVTGHEIALINGSGKESSNEFLFRIELKMPLVDLLARDDGTIGLADAELTFWDVSSGDFGSLRMVEISRDGKQAFMADHGKPALWKFDPSQKTASFQQVTIPEPARGVHLFSDTQLLVTTKTGLYFQDLSDSGNNCTVELSGLCGYHEFWNSVIDPRRPDSVLVFAFSESGGALFEVRNVHCLQREGSQNGHRNSLVISALADEDSLVIKEESHEKCEVVAGNKHQSGFRDGLGQETLFARPHHMRLIPDESGQLLLTDIDNHALRLFMTKPESRFGSVSTVIYEEQFAHHEKSDKNCTELRWELFTASVCRYMVGKTPTPWKDADQHCMQAGARLCKSTELGDLDGAASWTASACISDWHPFPGQSGVNATVKCGNCYEDRPGGKIMVSGEDGGRLRCTPESNADMFFCCADA